MDEYEAEEESEQAIEGRGCYHDNEVTKIECVIVANRLVEQLCLLELPRYKDFSEIEIPHLLTMYCRMMDLNFDDFIPSRHPWNTIEQILLSLRDAFGADKFNHLDSMMIAVGEPTYFLCLLQIFDTIVSFHKKNGRRFDNLENLNRTILTDSEKTNVSPPPAKNVLYGSPQDPTSSTPTDLELDVQILQNSTGNDEIDVGEVQETSKGYKLQVFIPKLPKPPNGENEDDTLYPRSINHDVGVYSPNELPFSKRKRKTHTRDGKAPEPTKSAKPGKLREIANKKSRSDDDIVFLPQKKGLSTKTAEEPASTVVTQKHDSLLTETQRLPPTKKQSKDKTQTGKDEAENVWQKRKASQSVAASSSKANAPKRQDRIEEISRSKDQQSVVKASRVPAQRIIDHVDNNQRTDRSPTEDDEEDEEGSPKLEGAYKQLHEHLLNELIQMEAEVASMKKSEKHKRDTNGRAHVKSHSSKVRYDYFGRPIRERFPYYPYGIIRPRCYGSEDARARRVKPLCSSKEGKENLDRL